MTMQETDTETKSSKVAEHRLLDAGGSKVDQEEQASGYEYQLVDGPTFKWQWTEANDAERRMLALFGAKTLATNETSQLRNNAKRKADKDNGFFETPEGHKEQLDAIVSRFGDLRNGIWLDRTREPGVPRIDKAKLATAAVTVKIAAGKATEADRDAQYARVFERLETDEAYFKSVRAMPAVIAEYAKAQGKSLMSADEI